MVQSNLFHAVNCILRIVDKYNNFDGYRVVFGSPDVILTKCRIIQGIIMSTFERENKSVRVCVRTRERARERRVKYISVFKQHQKKSAKFIQCVSSRYLLLVFSKYYNCLLRTFSAYNINTLINNTHKSNYVLFSKAHDILSYFKKLKPLF